MRGTFYDSQGLSYLFDMNEEDEKEKRENKIQYAYNNEFFPLCLDSMFYGNESRFINHSCDSNATTFNICGFVESQSLHQIGLFAGRKI
jgi:SET domain-containing protein